MDMSGLFRSSQISVPLQAENIMLIKTTWRQFTSEEVRSVLVVERLHERFANTQIEVAIPARLPTRVQVIKSVQVEDEISEEEIFYTVNHSDPYLHAVPPAYINKWLDVNNMADIASARRFNLFYDALKKQANILTYDEETKNWRVKEEFLHEPEGGVAGGEQTDDKPKDVTALEKNLTKKLQKSFLLAMCNKMCDSKGRDFVNNLLNAACYVCLGEEYEDYVSVMCVGTAPWKKECRKEGFPVKQVKMNKTSAVSCHDRNLEDSFPEKDTLTGKWVDAAVSSYSSSKQTSHRSVSPGIIPKDRRKMSCTSKSSMSESPVPSSFGSTMSRTTDSSESGCWISDATKSDYVYPDCIVISNKNPVYLLVVEIESSGNMKHEDVAQLYREMIGAGLYQSEVFGILINQEEVRILRMKIDDETKKIHFSTVWEHCYLDLQQDFSKNFQRLVSLLDYGSMHIEAAGLQTFCSRN